MDEFDADRQHEIWKADAANHLLQAAHALATAFYYAEDANPEWYDSRIGFLLQEAETLLPTQEAWPELADNVVPISQYMGRK